MPTHLPIESLERARGALRAAADGERRIRDALTYGRAAPFFIVWGAVWTVGFVGPELGLRPAPAVWGAAVAAGWIGTALLTRTSAAREVAGGSTALRYTLSAALLSAHAMVWASVLLSHTPNALGVYAGSVTGCAYAVAGLWRGALLVALGLAITVLFLAGLLVPPTLFPVYAGVLGGGGLVAAGLLLGRLDPT